MIASSAACAPKSASNAVNSESAATPASADTAARSATAITTDSVRPKDQPATEPKEPSEADTARGIVRRYGADPLSRLALAPADGSDSALLALTGTQMSELAAAEGLEVMVAGERTSERAFDVAPGGAVVFKVQRFVVRAADGVEARDGVLVIVGGQPFLETEPGVREPLTGLPAILASQMGARIFLVGPRGRAPQAFGVLRKP